MVCQRNFQKEETGFLMKGRRGISAGKRHKATSGFRCLWDGGQQEDPELLKEKRRSFKRNKNDSISNGNILDILTLGRNVSCIGNLSSLTLTNMSVLAFIQRKSRNLEEIVCICVLPQERNNLLDKLH